MRPVVVVGLLLAVSCRDPSPREPADAQAPSAASTSPTLASAASPVSSPPASTVAPAPSASAARSERVCPDAGPTKDSPITLVYTQVFVPDPGRRRGTTFSAVFRGQAVPVPQADEIYSWCSADKTEDPTRFELRCHGRASPVCAIQVREESVSFECGAVRRDFDVPCGARATLKTGRLPGTLAYH